MLQRSDLCDVLVTGTLQRRDFFVCCFTVLVTLQRSDFFVWCLTMLVMLQRSDLCDVLVTGTLQRRDFFVCCFTVLVILWRSDFPAWPWYVFVLNRKVCWEQCCTVELWLEKVWILVSVNAECAALVSQFSLCIACRFFILACSEYVMQQFKVEFMLSVQQVVKWVLIRRTQGNGQRAHWICGNYRVSFASASLCLCFALTLS